MTSQTNLKSIVDSKQTGSPINSDHLPIKTIIFIEKKIKSNYSNKRKYKHSKKRNDHEKLNLDGKILRIEELYLRVESRFIEIYSKIPI